MRLQAERRRDGIRGVAVREADPPAQVQPVAVGELAEPVEVHLPEEGRGGGVDRLALHLQLRGHRRLVVADAGDQVQHAQRLPRRLRARRVEPERRARQGHRLHQLGAVVEGVHEPRHAGVGIEAAAHEAEGADRVAVEGPIVHALTPSSSRSCAGRARRLYSLAML